MGTTIVHVRGLGGPMPILERNKKVYIIPFPPDFLGFIMYSTIMLERLLTKRPCDQWTAQSYEEVLSRSWINSILFEGEGVLL